MSMNLRGASAPIRCLFTMTVAIFLALLGPALAAEPGATLEPTQTTAVEEPTGNIFQNGTLIANLRYRYETVDQAGFAEDAQASTMRLRLGYRTGVFHHFSAYADFESLTDIGTDRYNSTSNGRTQFPVVADPSDTELNQLYFTYDGLKNTVATVGRQRIILDNARFVGNVGWRQNEQTFDAVSIRTDITEKIRFSLAHIGNVNRIFGRSHPNPARADTAVAAELVNVGFKTPVGDIVGYSHLLDLKDNPGASHKNFGLRFSGNHSLSENVRVNVCQS